MDENIALKSCQELLQLLEDLNAMDNLILQLKELILIQSNHVKEPRRVLISKEYGLKKLLYRASSEGQDNWKKKKKKKRFAPAINFIKCRIIELKECIKKLTG